MKLKARTISILKGQQLIIILVREDKKVYMNFGSDDWIDFLQMFALQHSIKNQKYQQWVNNPHNKKNFQETLDVITNAGDYLEVCKHFVKDFKSDRGARIVTNDLELETDPEKMKEALKRG